MDVIRKTKYVIGKNQYNVTSYIPNLEYTQDILSKFNGENFFKGVIAEYGEEAIPGVCAVHEKLLEIQRETGLGDKECLKIYEERYLNKRL